MEVTAPWFVDVHSHVVPSGDDGAETIDEGLELCRLAVESGTRVLFATPHMHAPWDTFPWSEQRAHRYDEALAVLRERAAAFGLDLRRGAEVYPTEVHDSDASELRLGGTSSVLLEFPGWWLDRPGDVVALMTNACEVLEGQGLTPVLAHPERCRAIADDPSVARLFADRGWLLCLNAPSLVGVHGRTAEQLGWRLLEDGVIALAASDGHRAGRPPVLADAYDAVVARLGETRARPLFDGSALPWVDEALARAAGGSARRARQASGGRRSG